MERTNVLSNLAANGSDTAPDVIAELAFEFDIPTADLLVIAGHPVPTELFPPQRDTTAMKQFAYLASHCGHAQLAALEGFVRSARWAGSCPICSPSSASPTHRTFAPYNCAATSGACSRLPCP
ncbi:hypothetical protein [Streptomyces virginiae]|uniref:hypothetical protein n=1 Tax=Streptomyces virginiae TaxID=1961 RepID=UPI00324D7212